MLPSQNQCQVQNSNNRVEVTNLNSPEPQNCILNIAKDRPYHNLGYVEAKFQAEDRAENNLSMAYLEMRGYLENSVLLRVQCGITHVNDQFQSVLNISIQGDPNSLTCPSYSKDMDSSDGKCDIDSRRINNLQASQDYILRLEADSTLPNVFHCYVNDTTISASDEYYIDSTQINPNSSSLSDHIFERRIEAWYEPHTTITYFIDDIYQGR